MYIEYIPNRKSRPTILLREARREGSKVRKKTIANLTNWPEEKVSALKRLLKGERLISPSEAFTIERSAAYGHAKAILTTIEKIGMEEVICPRASKRRDLVVAMIAETLIKQCRISAPDSPSLTALPAREIGLEKADDEDRMDALDWLCSRKKEIEKGLCSRHLSKNTDGFGIYTVTPGIPEMNSYTLMDYGYGKGDEKTSTGFTFGIVSDHEGRPVASDVYHDNGGIFFRIHEIRRQMGLDRIIAAGGEEILGHAPIQGFLTDPRCGWVSEMYPHDPCSPLAIERLRIVALKDGSEMIIFPDLPEERLLVMKNPVLRENLVTLRASRLNTTERLLERLRHEHPGHDAGLSADSELIYRAERILHSLDTYRFFDVRSVRGSIEYSRREDIIHRESLTDGLQIIRSRGHESILNAQHMRTSFKILKAAEQMFTGYNQEAPSPPYLSNMEFIDAHALLCLLAYYVEWHMRRLLAPMLCHERDLAQMYLSGIDASQGTSYSMAARGRNQRFSGEDTLNPGFRELLAHLGEQRRNECRFTSLQGAPSFTLITEATPLQRRAFELLEGNNAPPI